MVAALAFGSVAISTIFAQILGARAVESKALHHQAWFIAVCMYAAASIALALGLSTGWDAGTFKVFYLFGAILNVPWLALGSVALLSTANARKVAPALLLFTGFATGAVLGSPLVGEVSGLGIPTGADHLEKLPRILAGIGSGLGTLVIVGLGVWSIWRRSRDQISPKLLWGNLLVLLGVLTAASGGLFQAFLAEDAAFTLATTLAIAVIFAGFRVASGTPRQTASSAKSSQ